MTFPAGVNALTLNRSKPFIDVKTTTVNGVMKQIVTDYFLPNTVDGVNGFYGSVIQVVDDPTKFENGSGHALLNAASWLKKTLGQAFSSGQMDRRYKVRIPDLDYCKPNPFSLQDKSIASLAETQKNILFDLFDEFTVSPDVLQQPVLGDTVFVTFRNLQTRRDGVILHRVGPVPTGFELLNSPLGGIIRSFAGALPVGQVNIPVPPPPPEGPRPELQQLDIGIPVNAAIKGDPLNPNPNLYASVIDQFRVSTNPRYVKRDVSNDGKNDTFCNILVYDVTRAMGIEGGLYWFTNQGVPIPAKDHDTTNDYKWSKDYRPQNAPHQYEFLRSDRAKKLGWRQVSALEAQVAANIGFCVISGGHGHVTVIRPGVLRTYINKNGEAFDDPVCSSAGGDNKDNIFNSNSYGYLNDVTYHVYISPKAGANFYEQKKQSLKSIYLPLENQINDLKTQADKEEDPQKKYTLKKQVYDITQSARSFGSALERPTLPAQPKKPAVSAAPRPSNASKKA
jgi:hypothetical protein